jgi:hypothetical protein
MNDRNWLTYKVQQSKLDRTRNDPSYEQVNIFFDVCPICEDSDWEIEVFGHKETHGLKIFRSCYRCGHAEQVRRLIKV